MFQSVVIAGGYGTGRELAEFFLMEGPVGGLLAMAVSTLLWSLVCVVTYELARRAGTFDYRTFFKELLGPGWVVYEAAYLVFMLLILAVIAAASGSLLEETFGLPYWVGVVGIMVAVGALVLGGSQADRGGHGGLVRGSLRGLPGPLLLVLPPFRGSDHLGVAGPRHRRAEWGIAGVRYAAYNIALIPPLLFPVRHLRSRRGDSLAGILAGPIAMVPGLLFYLAMVGQYPAILDRPVPANFLLEVLGSRGFQIAFQVVLFGTLIETGAGLIHGMNERIAHVFQERGREMPPMARPALALGLLLAGTLLAGVGLVDLIARGYGTLTWVFLVVYVVPVLTLGLWRITRPAEGLPGRSPDPGQPQDRTDAEDRPQGEDRERPGPSEGTGQDGDALDGDHGKEEPHGGLKGQGGAHGLLRGHLRHQGAELGRIGDDEEPPDPGEGGEDPEAPSEEEADQERADAAGRHGDVDQSLPPHPVGGPPSPDTPQASGGDGAEGGQLHQPESGASRRSVPGHLRTGQEEGRNPGPHCVQLPHVAQVAEDGQAGLPVTDHPGQQAPGERGAGEGEGAVPVGGENQDRPEHRTPGRRPRPPLPD